MFSILAWRRTRKNGRKLTGESVWSWRERNAKNFYNPWMQMHKKSARWIAGGGKVDKPMAKRYVLQMRIRNWDAWSAIREFGSLEEAAAAYNALPIKCGYRIAEAYTVVRYKAVRVAPK